MIKYLGSKRRLVPVLGEILRRSEATTALDLFTGTTRVAQAFKAAGAHVTAVDTARYSEVLARCHVAADAATIDRSELAEALADLASRPGTAGYVTETFCVRSRFFQPFNGERIDAIRTAIDEDYGASPLRDVLLTSLIEAADRVDSTTGLQMAYVKQWAPRSYRPLELRVPAMLPGSGAALRCDARAAVSFLPPVDLAYLDPPYNQHRYFTNYHVWETLVAWDAPDHYGVACKRADCRDPSTHSVFNRRREMPAALRELVGNVSAEIVVVSYNNESWLGLDELVEMCAARGSVAVLGFDHKRYVGAQIGVFSPSGERVGRVSHLRNTEYVVLAGPAGSLRKIVAPFREFVVPPSGQGSGRSGSRASRTAAAAASSGAASHASSTATSAS